MKPSTLLTIMLLLLCAVSDVSAQNISDAETRASLPFGDRLISLTPSNPEGYFNLAEEIADAADDVGTRKLATRLYALAYELARTRGRPSLAASAAIGLSAVATNERDRSWLLSI